MAVGKPNSSKETTMNPFNEIVVQGKVSEETKGGGAGHTDGGVQLTKV